MMRNTVDARSAEGRLTPTLAIYELLHLLACCLDKGRQIPISKRVAHQSFNIAHNDIIIIKESIDAFLIAHWLVFKSGIESFIEERA